MIRTNPYIKELKRERKKNRRILKQHSERVKTLEKSGQFVNLTKKRHRAFALATGLVFLGLSLGTLGFLGLGKISKDDANKQQILKDLGYPMYSFYADFNYQKDLMYALSSGEITQEEYDQKKHDAPPTLDEKTYVQTYGTQQDISTFEKASYNSTFATIGCAVTIVAGAFALLYAYTTTKFAPTKFDCGDADEYAAGVVTGKIDPDKHPQFEPKFNPDVANFMDF